MRALRGIQLQGSGDRVYDGLGRPDLASLFQTLVAVGTDPRKLGNLLAAQPRYAALSLSEAPRLPAASWHA